MEHRIRNVRFIGELAKFGVCPTHIVFYCFKRLIQPEPAGGFFNDPNVEVACHLLEACGRYMLKGEETGKRFSELVRNVLHGVIFDFRYCLGDGHAKKDSKCIS